MISRQRKTALKVWCRTHCRLFWEKKKNLFFRQFLCVSSIETFYPKETLASFSFSTEVETVSRPFPCPSFHGNSLLETPLWFFFLETITSSLCVLLFSFQERSSLLLLLLFLCHCQVFYVRSHEVSHELKIVKKMTHQSFSQWIQNRETIKVDEARLSWCVKDL